MRNIFLALLLLLTAFTASAASRISMMVVVTNTPVTSNTLTVSGSTRTWTNASSSSTIQTNLTSAAASTTNLFNAYASYPLGSGITINWESNNAVRFWAPFGATFSGSLSGPWGYSQLYTQSGPSTFTALWPIENMVGETNRTNQGSSFVYGLGLYSTNAFPTNSTALSNYITSGASPGQTITSPLTLQSLTMARMKTNSVIAFTNAAFKASYLGVDTNGFPVLRYYDGTALDPIDVFGFINQDHILTLKGAAEVFPLSSTNNLPGFGFARNTWRTANTWTNSDNIFQRGFTSTNALLYLTKATNSVTEGNTNSNSRYTGTNAWPGRLDFNAAANSGLANGNNAGVILGTNVYIKLSGPSSSYTLNGIVAEQDGSFHIIEADNPALSLTIANDSGVDPTAANRITTCTGGSLTLTNNPAFIEVIYNTTASRWRVKSFSR